LEETGPFFVNFQAILTEIRTSGVQEGPRGDVSTVEIEQHGLVNDYKSNGRETGLMYVRLDAGEGDILRFVKFLLSRELWADQFGTGSFFSLLFRTRGRWLGYCAHVGACAVMLFREKNGLAFQLFFFMDIVGCLDLDLDDDPTGIQVAATP
jgi:hypothetical protein